MLSEYKHPTLKKQLERSFHKLLEFDLLINTANSKNPNIVAMVNFHKRKVNKITKDYFNKFDLNAAEKNVISEIIKTTSIVWKLSDPNDYPLFNSSIFSNKEVSRAYEASIKRNSNLLLDIVSKIDPAAYNHYLFQHLYQEEQLYYYTKTRSTNLVYQSTVELVLPGIHKLSSKDILDRI